MYPYIEPGEGHHHGHDQQQDFRPLGPAPLQGLRPDTGRGEGGAGVAGWEGVGVWPLNQRQQPMVFILWGNNAKAKEKLITNPNHLIIKSAHPSPLSAHYGFWGGKYFSRTNEFLESTGQEPIDWRIPE